MQVPNWKKFPVRAGHMNHHYSLLISIQTSLQAHKDFHVLEKIQDTISMGLSSVQGSGGESGPFPRSRHKKNSHNMQQKCLNEQQVNFFKVIQHHFILWYRAGMKTRGLQI
ncbi:hypothetical protein ILYODFUR_005792 [Ilyodon furcidens]|uniref:Uncharacterized protein n=1 Tax=Ilyodon furcidens TaxID=33524 RepID=A0ABV0V2N7_9TELE